MHYKFLQKNFLRSLKKFTFLTTVSTMCALASQAQFPAPYCTPTGITSTSNIEPISYVAFAGIDNTSSATVGSGAIHEDFTAQTATVYQGLSHQITLKGNTGGSYVNGFYLYFDWNQDGDFLDANEQYIAGSINNSTGVDAVSLVYNVNVPATAALGNTRMRIIKRYLFATPSPNDGCTISSSYGQVEDYSVTVISAPCTAPTVTFATVPNCAMNSYSISVNITNLGSSSSLDITDGTDTVNVTTAGTYSIGNYTSGTTQNITVIAANPLCNMMSGAMIYNCPPANDNITGAFALTVNPDLMCTSTTSGNTNFATASLPAPSCNATGANDDIWFSFVATSNVHRIALTTVTGSSDLNMVVYESDGTTEVLTGGQCQNTSLKTVSSLVPGNTYYLRVYTWTSLVETVSNFTVCVTTPPPPPVNDNITGAIALTVNPDYHCGTTTAATTANATSSTPAPSCRASGANDDVWFSFVATNAMHRISLINTGGSTDMNMVVYQADGVTEVTTGGSCANVSTKNLTGLTPGNTYYLRVYTYSSSTTITSNFNVCVGTPPPPPINDDIANATSLTVNPTLDCTAVTTGTTESATASLPAPSCTAAGANDDVWYSFVATNSIHRISLLNITGGTSNMNMVVYEDDGTTEVATGGSCANISLKQLTGLTPGDTYYIRIYTNSSTATISANFEICVNTPPPPPSNDDIAGAIALTVNPDYLCGTVTLGNTEWATSSYPAPSCNAVGANDDVWFSFVATNTNHRISLINVSGTSDRNMVVYESDGITEVSGGGLCANISLKNLTGLTPGNTYYLRVFTYSSSLSTVSSFNVCVGTPPPTPINDDIVNATPLTVNPDFDCGAFTVGSTASATASTPAPSCAATGANDDIWYSFVATSTEHRITITNITPTTSMNSVVYQADGITAVSTGGSCGTSTVRNLTSLTPGNTYYIRVYTNSALTTVDATFNICVGTKPPPPVNDEATGAISLTLGAGCSSALYTNVSATTSATEPSCPATTTTSINKVWFKFTSPASGAVRISTDNEYGTLNDTRITLFEVTDPSDYSTFEAIAFDEDNGAVVNFRSIMFATGLTSGVEYYVMVESYSTTSEGTFCIAVDELDATMLSTTNTCTSTVQGLLGSVNTYTGYANLVDAEGKLVALVRNPTGGSASSFSGRQNIHTGTVRTDVNGKPYLSRNWLINNSSVTTPVEVQLFFLDSELEDLDIEADFLNITKVNGSTCTADLPTSGTRTLLTQSGNGSVNGVTWVKFNTTGFSQFFVGSTTAPLSVKLGNIAAVNKGSANLISWNTLSEIGGEIFELERSTDGRTFETIASIDAIGKASEYAHLDEKAAVGINFYRVKYITTEGQPLYSTVVNATVHPSNTGINLYPNPTSGNVTLKVDGKVNNGTITITDFTGRTLHTMSNIKDSEVQISLEQYVQGTYFIKFEDGQTSHTFKVTKL